MNTPFFLTDATKAKVEELEAQREAEANETPGQIKERQARGLFRSSELSEEEIKKNFFSSEKKHTTPMGYAEKKKLGLI